MGEVEVREVEVGSRHRLCATYYCSPSAEKNLSSVDDKFVEVKETTAQSRQSMLFNELQ